MKSGSPDRNAVPVRHDPHGSRFFLSLPDGDAELVYAPFSEDVLDVQHTEPLEVRRHAAVQEEAAPMTGHASSAYSSMIVLDAAWWASWHSFRYSVVAVMSSSGMPAAQSGHRAGSQRSKA